MEPEAAAFLTRQRVSVISILQEDTTVHAATLHFAYEPAMNLFFFLTHESSRKCRSLVSGKSVPASFVTGFDEDACATFQADGTIKMLRDNVDLEQGWQVYGTKYPERTGAKGQEGVVLLQFKPDWVRFSEVDTKNRFKS